MDLCNPTGDTITLMYDSVPYIFKPRTVMSIDDEAGRFLVSKGASIGLVEAHFGDDPEKLRYVGLRARLAMYQRVLEGHQRMNARQKELKFPPIEESPAVRQGRLALPAYEKAVGKLEDKLGTEADALYAKDLAQILDEAAVKVPSLSEATYAQLRSECDRLKIAWGPHWGLHDLRTAIEVEIARAAAAPDDEAENPVVPETPVAIPSGSVAVPGPSPDVSPDDLGGAFVRGTPQ